MKKYLLPCNCGQNVEVDASQAGLQVVCGCGAKLDVPTMRGLSQLRVAEAPAREASVSQAAWGPGQGSMFLGAVLAICGVIALALVWRTRPQWEVQTQQIVVNVERLSPAQLWEHWQDLRKGLAPPDDPVRKHFESDWERYRRHRMMAAIPFVLGTVMMVAGLVLLRAMGTRRERR
jgi:hypothetical protein